MGRRSRSRSRSRSRERRKSPKASRKEAKATKAKSPPRRKPASESEDESGGPPAWASDAEEAPDEDMPLEARVALLEVENNTLKAENKELRRKLVEALRRKPATPTAPNARRAAGRATAAPAKADEPPPAKQRDPEPSAADRRRERMARRDAEQKEEEEEVPPEDSAKNAVLLANDQMEAYNESIPNNIVPEKRLPLVNAKLERFLSHFDEKAQVFTATGGVILKDRAIFAKRYGCVFRESGAYLKGTTCKRFYYDAVSRPTYVIDFETHEHLVTAMPGTPPDGKLGVRKPRTEHLVVLYEEKNGKLTRMWLSQDSEKLGPDPKMDDEALLKTEVVKTFEAKIAELRDSPAAGPRIFQNYLDIPTVGA